MTTSMFGTLAARATTIPSAGSRATLLSRSIGNVAALVQYQCAIDGGSVRIELWQGSANGTLRLVHQTGVSPGSPQSLAFFVTGDYQVRILSETNIPYDVYFTAVEDTGRAAVQSVTVSAPGGGLRGIYQNNTGAPQAVACTIVHNTLETTTLGPASLGGPFVRWDGTGDFSSPGLPNATKSGDMPFYTYTGNQVKGITEMLVLPAGAYLAAEFPDTSSAGNFTAYVFTASGD